VVESVYRRRNATLLSFINGVGWGTARPVGCGKIAQGERPVAQPVAKLQNINLGLVSIGVDGRPIRGSKKASIPSTTRTLRTSCQVNGNNHGSTRRLFRWK
jgi:hypothetical protein